jgi:spermidine/putrescine transport system permease protein
LRAGTVVYALAFFAFLFLPLVVVAVFAFNDAPYPAPPWRGFTLDWFFGSKAGRTGLFSDGPMLASLWTSVVVAAWVTLLAVLVGTTNAFLIERAASRASRRCRC